MKVSSSDGLDILPERVLVLRIVPPSTFLKATPFPTSLAPLAVIGIVFDTLKVFDSFVEGDIFCQKDSICCLPEHRVRRARQ